MTRRLESYRLAGVDLSLQDASGRTALHLAAIHGHLNVVDYLLGHEVEFLHDLLGLTPLDYAKKAVNNGLIICSKLEERIGKLHRNSE